MSHKFLAERGLLSDPPPPHCKILSVRLPPGPDVWPVQLLCSAGFGSSLGSEEMLAFLMNRLPVFDVEIK